MLLLSILNQKAQTIVTTTDLDSLRLRRNSASVFSIEQGGLYSREAWLCFCTWEMMLWYP